MINFEGYIVINNDTHNIEYMCLNRKDLLKVKSKYVETEWLYNFTVIKVKFDYDTN